MNRRDAASLRSTLLGWLLVPTVLLLPVNAYFTYREGVDAANAAYDRSLLLSARAIAERIRVERSRLTVDLPYAALDMTQNDIGGQLYYRVSGLRGEFLSGFDDLPPLPPEVPLSTAYPALVRFYDARYRDRPLRVAALFQAVNEEGLSGMALVQVAETYESRDALIQRILLDTLQRQALLLGVAVVLIVAAVRRGLKPLDRLGGELESRDVQDLTPLDERKVPEETRALVVALNRYIGRMAELVALRKRFIENAAHQLRTPIAVLKTQIGVARREGDTHALRDVVEAMDGTADNAARLANQLLSLTRAEHGVAASGDVVDLAALARGVCLDAAPRARDAGIDLGLEAQGVVTVPGDPVLLHEMLVNLLDNALKYAGAGQQATVRVAREAGRCVLMVDDSGPGIPEAERGNVLKRFYRVPGQAVPGSGLGLAIVAEIVAQHGGQLALLDAPGSGLRVRIALPCVAEEASTPSPARGRGLG